MAVNHPRVVNHIQVVNHFQVANHLEVAEGPIALKIHLAAPSSSLH
jgi:hypothetical protein